MTSPYCALTRRGLVFGAGAAGLAALVAGCGADEPPPAASPGASSRAAAPATTAPAATAPDLPPGALARTADVPVGGGVIVEADGPVLVVQPAAGVFRAFSARCPHQNFVVGTPAADGVVTCPGHLAHYRAADGSLIDGPAPRGLDAVPVAVADGHVRRA
jgi:nitrite reductase/ring-hydroxylating ferredoxin subunit